MKMNYIKFLVPVLAITITSCIKDSRKQNSKTGFTKVENVTMVASDFDKSYAPSLGDVKMLVIPITFVGEARDVSEIKYQDWTEAKIHEVEGYYFGEEDSLASYYTTASLGQLNVTGKVTAIYENSTIKTSRILNSYNALFSMIRDAVNWVHENDNTINWSEYDLNQDGCIDSVHLITNYVSTEWGETLWPHKYNTNYHGTVEWPMANVYSISSTGFMNNAITGIHEQGHIFGLDDYYDYTSQGDGTSDGIDYVGQFDMQSSNVFDWNSYSKLSMGWVKPYVINGEAEETTITIKAASLNGDCILVPADYSKWNGSAFDEYILIELFAPYGNNEKDWYRFRGSLGSNPGLRVYHVDGRMFGSNDYSPYGGKITVEDVKAQQINSVEEIENWEYVKKGANNCSNWYDYGNGIEQLADVPQLNIIQKGGDFTFARENGRHTLHAGDLFKKGDTFTWRKYSHFFNKSETKQYRTSKGALFPYSFTVDYIDAESATITFTKVK